MKLDSIDCRILLLLQADATAPIQAIADAVGLTANPCWRRIKRLEDEGVIRARVAVLDAEKVGLGATAFVAIRTDKHSPDWLAAFARAVAAIPEIVECHRMSGDIDYLLKVAVADIAHYDRVYQRLITLAPGISDVSSTFSMERIKQSTVLPVLETLPSR